MKAELRNIQPNDYLDWDAFVATAPLQRNDHGWFTLDIGPEGEPGSDMFQVHVATPAAASRARNNGERQFRGVIVESFAPEVIAEALRAFVMPVTGGSWAEIVEQLRQRMTWEYEGMAPV